MNPPTFPILMATGSRAVLLACLLVSSSALQAQVPAPPEGFTAIFNGKDFSGWGGATYAFQIKDGVITCKPDEGGTIYTRRRYSDFVVQFEFKLPPEAAAGLAIRYPGSGHPAYVGMCQIQLVDEASPPANLADPRQKNGAAYGLVAARAGHLRPAGEWNLEQVTVKGSTIKVELNGATILEADLSQVTESMDNHPHPGKARTSGHLGLIADTDPVQFRNLRIKPLP